MVPSSALATLKVPVCQDCTSVAQIPSGTTRFVLQPLPATPTACYRMIAKAGDFQSLFTPQVCINIKAVTDRQAAASASASASAAAAASASASAAKTPSCTPTNTVATPAGATSMALEWTPATKVPKGAKPGSCDPKKPFTGYEMHLKNLGGGADVPIPGPPNDTAFEATDLPQGVKLCFRIRVLDATGHSDYSKPFCNTLKVTSPSPTASTSASGSASPSAS